MIRVQTRGFIVAAGVAAGVCGAAAPAWGEVGAPGATVQAIAADAQFLEYAAPPPAPGVVCLVDSGVDANPDTTPILAGSYALEPGTDTSDELSKLNPPLQPGNHPDGHGTYMAMLMAAPVNGWGMVGIAPTSVRVFNLKALAAGQAAFTFGTYGYAINHCIDGPVGTPGISVINLSLGSATQPTPSDLQGFEDTVGEAGLQGFSVVAAAGNDGGAVGYPAAASGVFAVGAADASPSNLGVFCAFSNRGSALSILAPGCGTQSGTATGVDVAFSDDGSPAWAYGTSEASAVASAVLASMRAYGPSLTAQQAEGCLTSTVVSGGNLDAAAAFRACGLGNIVDQGASAYAAAIATQPQQAEAAPPASVAHPSAAATGSPRTRGGPWTTCPHVTRVRFVRGVLTVSVAFVPSHARLRVDAERARRRGNFRTVASVSTAGRRAAMKVSSWGRLAVLFVKTGDRSAVLHVNRYGQGIGTSRRTMAPVCKASS